MCLITEWKEPKVAEQDIIVYKMMYSNLLSYYMDFRYTYGELFQEELREAPHYNWNAFDQVDSDYLNLNYPGWARGKTEELKCIERGFHSAKTKERLASKHVYVTSFMVECTIPLGSLYYEDATGCIVSNQIIINKEI